MYSTFYYLYFFMLKYNKDFNVTDHKVENGELVVLRDGKHKLAVVDLDIDFYLAAL